jgi:hypothetical protein
VIATNFGMAGRDFIDKSRFLPTFPDFYPPILNFLPETFFINRRQPKLSTCLITDVFDFKRWVTIFLRGDFLTQFSSFHSTSALRKIKISKMKDVNKLGPHHQ